MTDAGWSERNNKSYPYFIDANGNFQVTREGNVKLRGGHISNMDNTSYIDLHTYNPSSPDAYEQKPFFLQVANSFFVTKVDGTIISRNGRLQNIDNTCYIDCGEGTRYEIRNGQIIGEEIEDYFLMNGEKTIGDEFIDYFSVTKEGYLKSIKGYIGGFYISESYISSVSTLSDTQNAITLSKNPFVRNIWKSKAILNSDYEIISYTNTDQSISGLKFAIDKSLGVTSAGDVYISRIHTGSVEADVLKGENLYITGSSNRARISANTVEIDGNSITISGSTSNPSSCNIPFGVQIGNLIFSSNNIKTENNTSITFFNNKYTLTTDNFTKYIGNTGYDAAWITASENPVGSSLDEGMIYIQYE